MRRWMSIFLVALLSVLPFRGQSPRDSERLGMALEYFTSGKYHEALLIFEQLDRQYKLNPRFHAYMGICYYHEWDYGKSIQFLEEAIPHLEGFAPHERSVYYFTTGESHFELQHYSQAIPWYEKDLSVCYENEKPEIYYKLSLCHVMQEQWESALPHLEQAISYYERYPQASNSSSRVAQLRHMHKGCLAHLRPLYEAPSSTDSVPATVKPLITNMPDSVLKDTLYHPTPTDENVDWLYQPGVEWNDSVR